MRRTVVVPALLIGVLAVALGACGSELATTGPPDGSGPGGSGTTTRVTASQTSTETAPSTAPAPSTSSSTTSSAPSPGPAATNVSGNPLAGRDLVSLSATDPDPAAAGFVSEVGRTIQIRLTFKPDGSFGFNGTCNASSGGYTVEDGQLVVGAPGLTTTLMACPDDRMHGDAWLGGLFEARPAIGIDGDRVTFTAGARRMVFGPYQSAGDRPLSGTQWELESIHHADLASSAGRDGTRLQPSLTFELGGRLHYADSCVGGTGRWILAGDQLTFSQVVANPSVRRCDQDPTGQDAELAALLAGGPVTMTIEGSTLKLMRGDDGIWFRARP